MSQEGMEVTQQTVSERKLIKKVSLDVETERFDTLLPSIEKRVTALGGYIEEMSSFSRSDQYSKDYQGTKYLRYASMTVRIPRQNLEVFSAGDRGTDQCDEPLRERDGCDTAVCGSGES